MPNYVLSRNERVFIAAQPTFGTAVAPANGDSVRHISCHLKPQVNTLVRRDKTGTRSLIAGKRGRQDGSWSIEASLVHGAAADDVPDYDPLYAAAFGAAATVTTGTSVAYTLSDVIKFFTLTKYVGDTGSPNHQMSISSVVNRITFNLGQDVAEFSAEGACAWVLNSRYFSSSSTSEKAGLGAFPTEPSAPISIGNLIEGFVGSISIAGNSIADITTATITLNTGNDLVRNTFGSRVPTGAEGDARTCTLAFSIFNSDAASLDALIAASITKTPVDATIVIGENAGSIYEFQVKGVQLESPDYDDSQRRMLLTFPESRAFGSSFNAKDELTMIVR